MMTSRNYTSEDASYSNSTITNQDQQDNSHDRLISEQLTSSTQSPPTSTTEDVWAQSLSLIDDSPISSTSTVVIAILAILTSLSLLLLFVRKPRARRYTTLSRITIMINIVLISFGDLIIKTPAQKKGDISAPLCTISILVENYWLLVSLMMLPLLIVERLIRTKAKSKWLAGDNQQRTLIGCLLIITYTSSILWTTLPMMFVFEGEKNTKCGDRIQYGRYYSFIIFAITILSVISTLGFAGLLHRHLKYKIRSKLTSEKRKKKLTETIHNIFILTSMLGLALVPHSISRQLTLLCGSRDIDNIGFCTHMLPIILYRLSFMLQKAVFTLLPIMFIGLDYRLRSKYWVVCCLIQEEMLIEEPMTTSQSIVDMYRHYTFQELYEEDLERDLSLLQITDGNSDLDRNPPAETPPEIRRAALAHNAGASTSSGRNSGTFRKRRKRISVDVDVLSMISERSEHSQLSGSSGSSRTSSERASFRMNYTNKAFDFESLQQTSVPRSLIRRTTSYSWIADVRGAGVDNHSVNATEEVLAITTGRGEDEDDFDLD